MPSNVPSAPVSAPEIIACARRWIGTPYHHQASLCGVGCDCLGLVRGVWRELYGIEAERAPAYSKDWAESGRQEAMLAAAQRHFRNISAKNLQPGDLIVFRLREGFVAKHAAIQTGAETMVHAVEGVGATEVVISPWWRRRIAGAFRFPGVNS